MRTRELGKSGIEASVVGLGAWAIGGWMWGGASEEDSIAAIHAGIDAGINLIDTAPIYGFGYSETVVGKAIKDRRDKVVLATKCGMVIGGEKGEPKFRSNALGGSQYGHLDVRVCLRPESIRDEVDFSLKRLQTDHIDLYQTHWQDSTTAIEDTMAVLVELKRAGKIRAIGVSNATVDHMDAYRKVGQLDSDQEKYSMLDRELDEDQLPYCDEQGISVLAYSPLALGLLTGKMGPDREFEVGDLRRTNPRFSVENRKRVQEMLGQFRPVAEKHNATLAQITIAWTVHQKGLTHALCGARRPQHAEENAAAGDIELSAEDLKTIDDALAEYTAKVT